MQGTVGTDGVRGRIRRCVSGGTDENKQKKRENQVTECYLTGANGGPPIEWVYPGPTSIHAADHTHAEATMRIAVVTLLAMLIPCASTIAQMPGAGDAALNFGLGALPLMSDTETRLVSPENPTGERGKGGDGDPRSGGP